MRFDGELHGRGWLQDFFGWHNDALLACLTRVDTFRDGKDAIVYWKAFNTEARRVDFLVGPDALSTFTSAPKDFATAAANAYIGEQDAATRESAKVVDLAVREGFGPAIGHLGAASKAAWSDPKWVAKTVFNVASARAGTTTTKAACAEAQTEGSAVTSSSALSPVASTARAHTIADVNPGYPAPGRTMNCVNCAVATDATLAGRPATALPSAHPLQLADIEQSVGGNFRRVGSTRSTSKDAFASSTDRVAALPSSTIQPM